MTIFKTDKNPHFFAPFGPTMGYFKMPDNLVNFLNKSMDKKLDDFSDHLVGKVTQELHFDKDIRKYTANNLLKFIIDYHQYTKNRNSMGKFNLDSTKKAHLDIVSAWFVRQFENEYNPMHIHNNCTLSCVGYLKLPDGIDEEWEEDYKDHYPANGHINFIYGSDGPYTCSNFLVKPEVGDFYIFPSYLFHGVYPFYTKGERRSFSMNMIFDMA
tara:strand:- start:110 stop:748 length:639 start_codon:yes stop_codon:yes gene_type:complete